MTSKDITVEVPTPAGITVNVSEIVPYEYAEGYTVTARITHAGSSTPVEETGKTVTVLPGDDVLIIVTNTFTPEPYFKARDGAENVFAGSAAP